MTIRVDSPAPCKRRRFFSYSMDPDAAKAKLEAARQKYGREIRVFETMTASVMPDEAPTGEETDDFYEFTPEDYYRVLATKKEDKFLKTRKIREAEEAARRAKITKAVIRVRFPDNHTLEATFHPSETIQCLIDLLKNVLSQPELPFYIYTTPPKKQVKNMSEDFYSAGFVPGAIVYFSYDLPKGGAAASANTGAYLQEDVMSLKDLVVLPQKAEPVPNQSAAEPVIPTPSLVPQEHKPAADKKTVKPKWLKM